MTRIPWRTIDQVECVPLADGSVLFRDDSPRVFALNRSGTEIWLALQKGKRREAAIRALMTGYGLSREESSRHVEKALFVWNSEGLFTAAQGTVPSDPGEPPLSFYSETTYRICGRTVRVRYSSASHEQQLHPRIAHLAVHDSHDAPVVHLAKSRTDWCVWVGHQPHRTPSSTEAVGLFFRMMLEAVAPGLDLCAQFHAAAVASPAGAVLLPGRKGCGKTTLTAALLSAGFDYLTDDVVIMDTRLKVIALPLALSIKAGSLAVLSPILPGLAAQKAMKIGGAWVKYLPVTAQPREGSERRLGVIVFPRFRRGASPELRRLTPFDCLRWLADSGSWFSREHQAAEKWALWLSETPSYVLEYSELNDGVESIKKVIS